MYINYDAVVMLFCCCYVSEVASRDSNHVVPKRHKLSIRNTRLMRGILFVIENLPYLLVSHACSFVLGAVTCVYSQ